MRGIFGLWLVGAGVMAGCTGEGAPPPPGGGGDVCEQATCDAAVADWCCPAGCATFDGVECLAGADEVRIVPGDTSVPLGRSVQLVAEAVYGGSVLDVTAHVTWRSADPAVVTVSPEGTVQTESPGSSAVEVVLPTASEPGASAMVTVGPAVLESIAIEPAIAELRMGEHAALTAVGAWSDGTVADVTPEVRWASVAPDVLVVDVGAGAEGLAIGVSEGRATVTATHASDVAGVLEVDVVGPPTNRAFVANYLSDTLSVIDLTLATVVATVPVGDGPFAVAAAPGANLVYVTQAPIDRVTVLDGLEHEVITTVAVGDNPQALAIDGVRQKAWVANFGLGRSGPDTVTVIDTSRHEVTTTLTVGQDPNGVVLVPTAAGARVLVSHVVEQIHVIDANTDEPLTTLTIESGVEGTQACLREVAPQLATGLVFVLHAPCTALTSGRSFVTVLRADGWAVEDRYEVAVDGLGFGLAVEPSVGGRVWVAHASVDQVSTTDAAPALIGTPWTAGDFPTRLAYAGPVHERLLVTNLESDDVTVIDTVAGAVVQTIPVGDQPRGIAVIP